MSARHRGRYGRPKSTARRAETDERYTPAWLFEQLAELWQRYTGSTAPRSIADDRGRADRLAR